MTKQALSFLILMERCLIMIRNCHFQQKKLFLTEGKWTYRSYYKDRELYQTLLFCPEGEEKQFEQVFCDFDFIRWHPVSVDVLPSGGLMGVI